MRTRSSRGSSARGGAGADAAGVGAGVGADTADALAVPAAMAANTSAFTKRPSLPLAAMRAGSRLFSSTKRRTAGDKGLSKAAAGAAAGGGGAAGAGAASAAGAGVAVGAAVAAAGVAAAVTAGAAPSAITPNSAPTSTVAPSAMVISAKVPAAGALTSRVTLSVSNSTNGSSAATPSPACRIHFATVASVTDSPKAGTLISVAISSSRLSMSGAAKGGSIIPRRPGSPSPADPL